MNRSCASVVLAALLCGGLASCREKSFDRRYDEAAKQIDKETKSLESAMEKTTLKRDDEAKAGH